MHFYPDSYGQSESHIEEMWSDQARAGSLQSRLKGYSAGYDKRKADKERQAAADAKKTPKAGPKADPRKATGEETNDKGERVKKYADGSTVTVHGDGTATHKHTDGTETHGRYKDPEPKRTDPEGFSRDTPESQARDTKRAEADAARQQRSKDTDARHAARAAQTAATATTKTNAEKRKNIDKQIAARRGYEDRVRYSRRK